MSVKEGEQAADAAIDQVRAGMDMAWYATAFRVVRQLGQSGKHFTTDDVWDALDKLPVATPEPRALGAVMRDAKRAGSIQPTNNYAKSRRAACHARPVRVWVGVENA